MRWLSLGALLFSACVHRTALMDLQDCLAKSRSADQRKCDKEYDACVENFGRAQCAKEANTPEDARPATEEE
jgi:hypothetical protein